MEFGTKVEIEGVGIRVCEDRGQRITAGHIDVYYESLSVAQKFGRKSLKVRVIRKG